MLWGDGREKGSCYDGDAERTPQGRSVKWLIGLGSALALPFAGLVAWLVVWYSVDDLGKIGDFLQGVGTVVLALGVVVGGGWALWRYFKDRDQRAEERRRQADLDAARLTGDLVASLRLRYERARDPEERQVFEEQLIQAEEECEGVLRGLTVVRPDLARAQQKAIMGRIGELTVEMQRLEGERGEAP